MAEDVDDFDGGDEEKVAKRKTKAQIRREHEIEDMRKVLATREGRAVLWRIIGKCGLNKTDFGPVEYMNFESGKKNVANWLILEEICAADPAAWANMQLEALQGKLDG